MRIALAALVLSAAALSRAEGGGGLDPMRQACGADAERLCAGSQNPGMCLHEHWDELSPACRSFKEGMKKRWQQKKGKAKASVEARWAACGADAERLCPGAPNPGACLHEHWDELSPACREFKEGMKKRWAKKNAEHAEGKLEDADRKVELAEKKAAAAEQKARFEWVDKKGPESRGLEPVEPEPDPSPEAPR